MKIAIIHILVILIFSFELSAQENHLVKSCKIESIDTSFFFPDYYLIKAETDIGSIVIVSEKNNNLNTNKKKCIRKRRTYKLELLKLDSLLLIVQDTIRFYWRFKDDIIRGGNGGFVWYLEGFDDMGPVIIFDDYNYYPFKAINLIGLNYIEIK